MSSNPLHDAARHDRGFLGSGGEDPAESAEREGHFEWPTASCCGEPRVVPDVDRCYDHAKCCTAWSDRPRGDDPFGFPLCGEPADDSALCPAHKVRAT